MIRSFARITDIRKKLSSNEPSIGSWMQLADSSVAEILGDAGYDWVAVDLEHGAIAVDRLPDLFRAIAVGGALPMARVAQGTVKDCKQALDQGAGGIIVPMIESGAQLQAAADACRWPPAGKRGVAFSRANLFGKYFETYKTIAQAPLLVAQIESAAALKSLDGILAVRGLDAVMVGPYDLSASLGITAQFDHPDFKKALDQIRAACAKAKVPFGEHVVQPDPKKLDAVIASGSRFVAYSIDTVFLNHTAQNPREK